jgi:hypothetical protein
MAEHLLSVWHDEYDLDVDLQLARYPAGRHSSESPQRGARTHRRVGVRRRRAQARLLGHRDPTYWCWRVDDRWPYAETKEQMGGFWVIEAPDVDAALDWARKAAAACGGPVELRPMLDEC